MLLIQCMQDCLEELLKSGNENVVFSETNYQEPVEKCLCDVGCFTQYI